MIKHEYVTSMSRIFLSKKIDYVMKIQKLKSKNIRD